MKIVSVVAASSNSGKTTLIEKLVRILKSRGFRVAVIKHAPKGFDLDIPGKDSWRFREAGADTVALVGPGMTAVMQRFDRQPDSETLGESLDADIVIQEGFRESTKNKIEVFRSGVSAERPLSLTDPSYIALVSDKHFEVSIPIFDLNDARGVAEFLIDKFPTKF